MLSLRGLLFVPSACGERAGVRGNAVKKILYGRKDLLEGGDSPGALPSRHHQQS